MQAEGIERMRWVGLDEGEQADAYFRLAYARMFTSEGRLALACQYERRGADGPALALAWARVDEELRAASLAAERGAALGPILRATPEAFAGDVLRLADNFPCLQTILASRLGDLPRARAGATGLAGEHPCAVQALAEFGHALHLAGLFDEAHTNFARALVLETELANDPAVATPDLACPVAGPDQAHFTADCSSVRCVENDPYQRWCSWSEYLRYRAIHAAHATGARGADATRRARPRNSGL